MSDRPVEPFAVSQMVETFVDAEHRAAAQYSNRSVLDRSGVYDLHFLAANIYAAGFNEGVRTEMWREGATARREHDEKTRAEKSLT